MSSVGFTCVPWSVVKKKLWVEKLRLAELFLGEVNANLKELSEGKLLSDKVYEMARGADQLELFSEELSRHITRTYDKVTTINDALVKYQKFRSTSAGDPGYEKKSIEFQQFLAWYRGGLSTSLQNLAGRLKEELEQKPEEEILTP
jgi:hypothetical protein